MCKGRSGRGLRRCRGYACADARGYDCADAPGDAAPMPGGCATPSAPHVRDAVPARLRRELDRLAAAVGLDVDERMGVGVEPDVELALLDALIEPRAPEDQTAQPANKRAIGRPDEVGPAVVDVIAERRGGFGDLAVHDEIDQILALVVVDRAADESELAGGLL